MTELYDVGDAMHWSPDRPAEPTRPAPLLQIDLTPFADDPEAARRAVETAVEDYARCERERLGIPELTDAELAWYWGDR